MSRLCCEYCGKEYKRRINYDNHFILCEIIYNARKKDKRIDRETEETNNELPSQKQMYQILQELSLKYNKLEEKVELMSKWVDKKKKKINVLDWLNTSSGLKPELIFDNLADSISILESDINLLFNGNFYDMLNEIFVRNIYDKNESEVSLFAFIQKTNTIYIYSKQNTVSETSWIELSRENLIYFLNKVHYKIVKVLIEWNKKNRENPNFSEKMEEMYNKSNIKLMGIDFKHEPVLSKIKFSIYNKMKRDMKALIEYEFEF